MKTHYIPSQEYRIFRLKNQLQSAKLGTKQAEKKYLEKRIKIDTLQGVFSTIDRLLYNSDCKKPFLTINQLMKVNYLYKKIVIEKTGNTVVSVVYNSKNETIWTKVKPNGDVYELLQEAKEFINQKASKPKTRLLPHEMVNDIIEMKGKRRK